MRMKHKITAVACASALALMGVAPAFAAEADATINKEAGEQDVKISAAVAKDNEKIISVTVPSQMAIAITTSQADGKFSVANGSTATVTNNEVSTASVKVEVSKVSQSAGLDSSAKLLDLVDLKLVGDADHTVTLAENMAAPATLFDSIAPQGSYGLQLTADKKAENPAIPTDSYTVNATLKVTAL